MEVPSRKSCLADQPSSDPGPALTLPPRGGRAAVRALLSPKPNRSGQAGCTGNGEDAPSCCTEVAANLVALETEIIIGRQLMATPRVGAGNQASRFTQRPLKTHMP